MKADKNIKATIISVICTAYMLFSGNIFAQQSVPPLDLKDVTLLQLFDKISKESKYVFMFPDDIRPDLNRKVTINTDKKNISEVLDIVFKNTNLNYKISERQITVFRKAKNIQTNPATNSKKGTITGSVIDAKTKEPIAGATVWIKESSAGTTTDVNGNYSINISGTSGLLSFSYLGYEAQTIPVGDNTTLDVQLKENSATGLDEVVVIAYGAQKKESVIGAIATISADQLKLPTSKISNVLAGQLAGVVSLNRTGEPGSGSDFYIRGISTFGSTKTPLVLVDGIERSLDLVDPEDILSFSILKDATATAVYGVRGANGVMLITTQKGKEGKPKISVSAETGLIGPTKMPKMVNSAQWAELYNEGYASANGGQMRYSASDIEKYKTGEDLDLYPNTNWLKNLYKDWTQNQRVRVNFSGGGTMARYYVAGSYYNEGSILKDDNNNGMNYSSSINYSKANFRSNLDLNITPSTLLTVNLATVYERKNQPASYLYDNGDPFLWYYAFITSPNAFPMKYSNGAISAPSKGTGYNPYQLMALSGYKESFYNNAQSTVSLTQDLDKIITPGLKANIKFSYDALTSNSVTRSFYPETWLSATSRNADGSLNLLNTYKGESALGYTTANGGTRVTYFEASMSYERKFAEDHQVGALLLYNQKEKNVLNATSATLALPYRNQGLAARLTYSYKYRYFGEINLGYNGSENFSPGKRFGLFPAGAVGWLISSEKFWEKFEPVVDYFKIRASYGLVGNDQIGGNRRFIYNATIVNNTAPAGSTGNLAYYMFNDNFYYTGIRIGDVANPNVGWETSHKTDLGMEVNFLKSTIRLQADYFYDYRTGIFLQRQSIADYAGLSTQPWVNIGKMRNFGFDCSLEMDQKIRKVNLTGRFNFTYAHNTLLSNDEPSYDYAYMNSVGQRYRQFFGYQAIGFFNTQEEINNSPSQFGYVLKPGDIKYKDINGDGTINSNDKIPIGYSSIPEIQYGFGLSAQWKGFDASFMFQGTGRISIQMYGNTLEPFSSGNVNTSAIYEEIYNYRWNGDNIANAKYPRVSLTSVPNNSPSTTPSTMWLRDGSFIRLKTAEIGYTIPKKVLQKTFINSLRVYASGLNLLTFSKFKLWDPELSSGDPVVGGGQGAGYAPNRTISVGIQTNM